MKYAYVTTNITDLWASPKYNSERVSQALFGQQVKITGQKKGYSKVVQPDKYSGWIDNRFLNGISKAEYSDLLRSSKMIIKAKSAKIIDRQGYAIAPFQLFYGTRFRTRKVSNSLSLVQLPGFTPCYVKTSKLKPIKVSMKKSIKGADLVSEARKFLGTPYLWGGISSTGLDCSGLVQAVFGSFGFSLPRDTKDQIQMGRKVDRMGIKSGDLVFFKRHVGIAIDSDRIIHCSIGGGGVTENSLIESGKAYRSDLDENFKAVRRII